MCIRDSTEGIGWHDARIVPYAPIAMDPATMVLHYAQETFEGLKAYRNPKGEITLFRPEMNARRMINSNKRICMAELPEDMFVEADVYKRQPFTCSKLASYVKKNVGIPTPQVLIKES